MVVTLNGQSFFLKGAAQHIKKVTVCVDKEYVFLFVTQERSLCLWSEWLLLPQTRARCKHSDPKVNHRCLEKKMDY